MKTENDPDEDTDSVDADSTKVKKKRHPRPTFWKDDEDQKLKQALCVLNKTLPGGWTWK